MAEIKWIKITTDIFNDEKILMIENMPDADSIIVIWFKLLCLAGRDNNNGILVMNNRLPYTEEMLASIFRRPLNTVRLALAEFEKYGMIETYDGVRIIPNWEKHQNIDGMDKIREQTRKRVAKHREKQKFLLDNTTCNVTVTDCNGTEEEKEEDIEKDSIKKHSASDNAPSKKDISEFFEKIWLLYPNKKGKGQVSDSKKKTLFNIGIEEITRAIERYKRDLSKEDWRKPQNGSTFFNSGYVDYLDANYSELIVKPTRGGRANGYNQAPQRQYEMDALERMLLEQESFKPETDPEFLAEAEALKRELQEKY